VQECLVLQADDMEALFKRLSEEGNVILEPARNEEGQVSSFQLVDPDGNRIKVIGVNTNREKVELKPGETSGFGFFDPDGNSFAATNVVLKGQLLLKTVVQE
jgi:hypothetical protein